VLLHKHVEQVDKEIVGILLLETSKPLVPLAHTCEELRGVVGSLGRFSDVKEKGSQIVVH